METDHGKEVREQLLPLVIRVRKVFDRQQAGESQNIPAGAWCMMCNKDSSGLEEQRTAYVREPTVLCGCYQVFAFSK